VCGCSGNVDVTTRPTRRLLDSCRVYVYVTNARVPHANLTVLKRVSSRRKNFATSSDHWGFCDFIHARMSSLPSALIMSDFNHICYRITTQKGVELSGDRCCCRFWSLPDVIRASNYVCSIRLDERRMLSYRVISSYRMPRSHWTRRAETRGRNKCFLASETRYVTHCSMSR
jgi:hypothetical protein